MSSAQPLEASPRMLNALGTPKQEVCELCTGRAPVCPALQPRVARGQPSHCSCACSLVKEGDAHLYHVGRERQAQDGASVHARVDQRQGPRPLLNRHPPAHTPAPPPRQASARDRDRS